MSEAKAEPETLHDLNVRVGADVWEIIEDIRVMMRCSRADLIERAIRCLDADLAHDDSDTNDAVQRAREVRASALQTWLFCNNNKLPSTPAQWREVSNIVDFMQSGAIPSSPASANISVLPTSAS